MSRLLSRYLSSARSRKSPAPPGHALTVVSPSSRYTSSEPALPMTAREPTAVSSMLRIWGAPMAGSTGIEPIGVSCSAGRASPVCDAAGAVVADATAGLTRPTPRDAVTMPQTTAALRNGMGVMETSS